ncbi:P-loop containing nucleoside triphosphate hydrolase protein [Bisporella sp. PMI_857]|nr:P-loop containing nucleoside triphosphate hydrolase protein [Bisporella sp. PMI_857]
MGYDNRADTVLERVLPSIRRHLDARDSKPQLPFMLGVTGLQGSGKSHLASALAEELNGKHKYNTIEVSLDDFYLSHQARTQKREKYPENKLLKTRGQPGTHDVELAKSFFQQFSEPTSEQIWIPSFDKSLFAGDGDRLPPEDWRKIPTDRKIDVLIFEGWCVGFQPLSSKDVEAKRHQAIESSKSKTANSENSAGDSLESQFSTTTLSHHDLDHLLYVNDRLEEYREGFLGPQHFDFLVHLDTDDLVNVYTWRLQQEHAMIKAKGSGMTDDQVVKFVQGYMPAYELYLDDLRAGFFRRLQNSTGRKKQLQLLMDIQRKVLKHSVIE